MVGEKKIKRPTKKSTTKRPTKVAIKKPTTRRPKTASTRSKTKRARGVVPVAQPVTPAVMMAPNLETVLPTPLHVEPAHIMTPLRKAKIAPHRWSLRHNFFTIFVLIGVGVFALAVIAGYADVTFRLINAYGTQTSTNLQPLATTERSFPTIGGNLTMIFPDRWQVTDTAENTIHWSLLDHPDQRITLQIDATEADNLFMWLQEQQPTYRNAQVVTPTAAVETLRGIMVEANDENNAFIETVYFPHQKDLADKYIVSVSLSVPADDALLSRSLADFTVFVNNLHLE